MYQGFGLDAGMGGTLAKGWDISEAKCGTKDGFPYLGWWWGLVWGLQRLG